VLFYAPADAGDVFELEAVEFFGEILEIDHGESVGLFELTGELGEKAIRSEADGRSDVGADLGLECGLDFERLGAGDRGRLPVGRESSIHLVD
jgi:hypothetical protein